MWVTLTTAHLTRHIFSHLHAHILMSHRHWLKFGVQRTFHSIPSSCAHDVVVLTRCDSPFYYLLSLFSPIVLVTSPNYTSRNPRSRMGPRMTSSTMTTPSAWRSLHHCSPRSEEMRRAVDELITLLTKVCRPVSRRLSGRPVDEFDSLISNVRENPRRSLENEQIRILLERQRGQILADCQAEIQKHEFQADYDRRSIQKLNETIESQRGEIYRAHQGDERRRQDQQLLHEQLLEQNWDLREDHEKSLNEMEELKRFQGSTFDTISRENWSKIETLSLNSQARFRNYRMKLIV